MVLLGPRWLCFLGFLGVWSELLHLQKEHRAEIRVLSPLLRGAEPGPPHTLSGLCLGLCSPWAAIALTTHSPGWAAPRGELCQGQVNPARPGGGGRVRPVLRGHSEALVGIAGAQEVTAVRVPGSSREAATWVVH